MIKSIKDINISGKKVLLRLDLNSPVVKGKILAGPRFKEASKTISYLLKNKAKVIILAHQSRKGESDFLPLEQHAKILGISYIPDLFGDHAKIAISNLKDGQAIILENVRDYEDETNINSKENRYPNFCKLFDVYVNDAFSVSHREQGSIIIPPKYLPSYIGLNFDEEINALSKFHAKKHAKNVFLLGGAKIEDYLQLFKVLDNKNNKMLVSGVLANLMLVAQGSNLGYENIWLKEKGYDKLIPKIKEIYEKYESQILLPTDFAVGNLDGSSQRKEIDALNFPTNEKIWDVGHQTIEDFKSALEGAKTIFMKGPLGFSEMPEYSYATIEILKAIGKSKAYSILGGGHLTETIEKYKIKGKFSHISTSGGALIAYLSGAVLPGIEALENSNP